MVRTGIVVLAVAAAVGLLAGCQPASSKAVAGPASPRVAAGPAVVPAGSELSVVEQEDRAVKAARDMVYPATVRVESHKTEYFGGQKKRTGGFGSGVIFDAQGHVLTNYHVAGRAEELSCTLFNKERVKAKLIGADPWTDLAVMQLDLGELKDKGLTLDWAPFGDSSTMSEGDAVLAIGSPYGLSRSISSGIISCHDRVLGEAMDLGGGLETGLFSTWLQTCAAINPGNSGGPLVNLRGEVIGINTRGGGNELGFAVPINVAKEVISQILKHGKVTRSDIGLKFQPLQDFESFFDVGKTEGAVISSVEPDSPAAAAGIKAQDILLEYNGHKVAGRFPEELFEVRRMIADTPVGSQVTMKIRHSGGVVAPVTLTTVELTTVRSEEVNFAEWGLVGEDITSRLAERENLKERKGVFVTGVRGGEPAEKAQLAEDDVIYFAGGQEINNVAGLKKFYDESVAKKEPRVLLKVRRGQAQLLKVLTLKYAETPSPAKEEKAPAAGSDKAAPTEKQPAPPGEDKKPSQDQ